jgi:hypothetical protein
MESVSGWARQNGFDYRFLGDEIFDLLDGDLRDKLGPRTAIASDLARLHALRQGLEQGYRRVAWLDADFLVFAPREFRLPETDFAVGRQVWVQPGERGRPRVYRGVHNAFLMFARANSMLDFYTATAARLLRLNQGGMPAQFIGPKLLSALHNIASFPVMESAAMLSPLVIRDVLDGGGAALDLLLAESPQSPAGANLCSSLTAAEGLADADMNRLIDLLFSTGLR